MELPEKLEVITEVDINFSEECHAGYTCIECAATIQRDADQILYTAMREAKEAAEENYLKTAEILSQTALSELALKESVADLEKQLTALGWHQSYANEKRSESDGQMHG